MKILKDLVIFDLDGTLLNTITDLGEAVNHALEEMHFQTHPLSAYNFMVGNGVKKLIQRAQPDATEEQAEQLLKYFREYYDNHLTIHTKPYPGIPELLEKLHRNNIAMAVCSNKYQEAVSAIISHYFPDIPFVAVIGQNPGVPIKPDPSPIFSVLLKYPTPKNKVLLVGDSAVDIETARRACIDSVGVGWGFRPVTELRKAYAGAIVYKPEEIEKLVFEV